MQFHPKRDYNGELVEILNPSTPTSLSAFEDSSKVAVVVPEGATPESLNDLSLKSLTRAPKDNAEWLHVDGQADFNEPTLQKISGMKLSAGVVTVEPDGRVWAVAPTNQFGGYKVTFPKGTIEKGLTAQATAIREAYEESGLQVELTGFIGDFERTQSVTRYYFARRISGNPADMEWESQAVLLIPKEKLFTLLVHPKDGPLITAVLAKLVTA